MPRLGTETNKVDVAALDIIRDRERGVPRFNEFRRQYGLQQLTRFDDFVDQSLPPDSNLRAAQKARVQALREVYGQHDCDETKIISRAQRGANGAFPNDCLGHPNGSPVDNVEDIDTVVGWLAEPVRPHGYAISETQFVVFILNASRRLFSDRFFTSSFRPERDLQPLERAPGTSATRRHQPCAAGDLRPDGGVSQRCQQPLVGPLPEPRSIGDHTGRLHAASVLARDAHFP